MKILIICTGNSCRSQMAESILKSFDKNLEVFSAGTKIEKDVNPYAIEVMKEVGINLSKNYPKDVKIFLKDKFDFVITVCDGAKEICPVFLGDVKKYFHIPFEDPANAKGSEEEILKIYRKSRETIKEKFLYFYKKEIFEF